jgi:hypothetical protein
MADENGYFDQTGIRFWRNPALRMVGEMEAGFVRESR